MPWKNGQGSTDEVLAFPADSDLSSFGWRISVAHVAADGPFSLFAGIDRTIALLDGGGLALDTPAETVELRADGKPFAFSGDLAIASRNLAGPTIDLNVMTRRGQYEHRMSRIGDRVATIAQPGTVLIFNGDTEATHATGTIAMHRFDAMIVDPADGPVAIDAQIDWLMIEVMPSSGPGPGPGPSG